MQPCSLLIRGGALITDPRLDNCIIENGAVCVQDDRIIDVGDYAELKWRYLPEQELGSPEHIVSAGLINAHDHGRAPSALQLGIPDDQLEAWLVDLLRLPALDSRLGTSYAGARQIEAGITTVAHSFYEGAAGCYETALRQTAQAYRDTGMRAMLVLSVLDQSIIAALLQQVQGDLPRELKQFVQQFPGSRSALVEEYFDVLSRWRQSGDERLSVMAGPVSVHWCSDALLQRLWRTAKEWGLQLQTHLLESPYQARSARARYGRSAIEHMLDLELLTPSLSCAHCVQVDENDIRLLAAHNVSVVHNAGSNLRLHNGIAPLSAMRRAGVNIALGLDSQSLNDNADMLQEMRLVGALHRDAAGQESPAPELSARELWQMATINGATALGIGDETGSLLPGKKADIVLWKPDTGRWPPVPGVDAIERLLYGGEAFRADTVVIGGDTVLRQGRLVHVDKAALEGEIEHQLRQPASQERQRFCERVRALKPYIKRYLNTYNMNA